MKKLIVFLALSLLSAQIAAREIHRDTATGLKVILSNGVTVGGNYYPPTRGDKKNALVRMDESGDVAGLTSMGITTATVTDYPDPHLSTYVEDEYGVIITTPRDPAVIAAEDALTAQLAQDDLDLAEIKAMLPIQDLLAMTPTQIDDYVDANVTDTASSKVLLKAYLKIVLVSMRKDLRN